MIALKKITSQLRNLSVLFGSAGDLADALESILNDINAVKEGYWDVYKEDGWKWSASSRSHVYSGPMFGRAFMPEFTICVSNGRLACQVGIGVHGCGVEFDLASGVPTYLWADYGPSYRCWGEDCSTPTARHKMVAKSLVAMPGNWGITDNGQLMAWPRFLGNYADAEGFFASWALHWLNSDPSESGADVHAAVSHDVGIGLPLHHLRFDGHEYELVFLGGAE